MLGLAASVITFLGAFSFGIAGIVSYFQGQELQALAQMLLSAGVYFIHRKTLSVFGD